jgi:hypothetical protein
MTTFLSSLGGKLAERWVTVLLLPGAGFLLAVACAVMLGHGHAFDVGLLVERLSSFAHDHSGGVQVAILAVLIVLGAAAAATLARATGRVAESVWIGQWPVFLATPLVAIRTKRDTAPEGINPVPAYRPQLPTWMGDRFRVLNARIFAEYQGLHLGLIWPRMWVLLDEPALVSVQMVNGQFQAATVLTGWGVLYLVLGGWWFPAAVIGAGTMLAGWRRGRTCTDTLATLIESTVDTQLAGLCAALNLSIGPAGISPELAARINHRLNKGA